MRGRLLRYGIVGTGMMGLEHLRSLQTLDGSEVVALADCEPSSLEAAAEEAPGASLFSTAEELVSASSIDVLVVATPNHTHREVLSAAWGHDVSVLVEKPLATTIEDALYVQSRAGRHRGIVAVGLEYRFVPAIAALIEEAARGTVGRLRMISVKEHRFPFLVKVGNWNRFNELTGGTLVEKCCHFFDLMNVLAGSLPTRVFASGGRDVNHLDESYEGRVPDILDNALCVLDYPGGIRASLELCMFAEGSRFEQELSLVGDAGKVEALVPGFMELSRGRRSELVIGSRAAGWPVSVRALEGDNVGFAGSHHGSTYAEHAALRAAILAGGPAPVGVDEGVSSLACGLAAQRSITEERPVPLAEILSS